MFSFDLFPTWQSNPPPEEEVDIPQGLLRLPNMSLTCYANTAIQYLNKPFLEIYYRENLEGTFTGTVYKIYRTVTYSPSYNEMRKILEKFFSICAKTKEFDCLPIRNRQMGDTMQFLDSLVLVIGRENPRFLDYFTMKLNSTNKKNTACCANPSCKVTTSLNEPFRQFNFIGEGIISHLLLQDLYLKVTCEGCEKPLNVEVEFPKYLLLRYNTTDPKRLAIDASFQLKKDITYKLTAIASSSGFHATCYIEKNNQWYSFSDYYYSSVNFSNEHFYTLPKFERPLGLVYSLEGNESIKITAEEILSIMDHYHIKFPSDPFTPLPVPNSFQKMELGTCLSLDWNQIKTPTLKFLIRRPNTLTSNKSCQTSGSNNQDYKFNTSTKSHQASGKSINKGSMAVTNTSTQYSQEYQNSSMNHKLYCVQCNVYFEDYTKTEDWRYCGRCGKKLG